MTRTLVVSDIHGEVPVLLRALENARFESGADRLIVAGDSVEVGSDGAAVVERIESLGADVLVGNHELALVLGQPIEDDTAEDPGLVSALTERVLSGQWSLVAAVDGVLVSHAGVSAVHQRRFDEDFAGDAEALAAWLNERWLDDLERAVRRGFIGFDDLTGLAGPLWFRPRCAREVLRGAPQVAGHTPPQIYRDALAVSELARAGYHITDPYVRGWVREGRPEPAPYRYAVIDSGEVRVRASEGE